MRDKHTWFNPEFKTAPSKLNEVEKIESGLKIVDAPPSDRPKHPHKKKKKGEGRKWQDEKWQKRNW